MSFQQECLKEINTDNLDIINITHELYNEKDYDNYKIENKSGGGESSDKELGSSDKELGSSDKELGSSDKELGSSDKELDSSDKNLGSSNKSPIPSYADVPYLAFLIPPSWIFLIILAITSFGKSFCKRTILACNLSSWF